MTTMQTIDRIVVFDQGGNEYSIDIPPMWCPYIEWLMVSRGLTMQYVIGAALQIGIASLAEQEGKKMRGSYIKQFLNTGRE